MITKEFLLHLFHYDRNQGVLFWKNPGKFHMRFKGKLAGRVELDGAIYYRQISIKNKLYLSHRLIWFLEYEYWPKLIDHIDGDGLNNRIDNLREVTNRKNGQNHRQHRKGKLVGAQWRKNQGFWTSQIRVENKTIHLGCFTTEHAAHERYMTELKERGL